MFSFHYSQFTIHHSQRVADWGWRIRGRLPLLLRAHPGRRAPTPAPGLPLRIADWGLRIRRRLLPALRARTGRRAPALAPGRLERLLSVPVSAV